MKVGATGLQVSVQDDKRNVTSVKSGRRGSPLDESKPSKRGRKRDWCRLCKSEECDHCYRFDGDTSSSGEEN
jgi:hypothetical protein